MLGKKRVIAIDGVFAVRLKQNEHGLLTGMRTQNLMPYMEYSTKRD